ncbi:hypothetical protein J5X84_19995 [Streptosporangiaceae bacterium NEAU-GS5]|nr:hypothetical protein [Streptosporangiaceae bacterium NEAU-GS5]
MDESEWDEKSRAQAAELEEKWGQWAAAQETWWKTRAAGQQEESLRQHNLMYGGLIGIGIVLVQPFLTVPSDALDISAKICVLAFAVAIPILAGLVLLNSHETYRRRTASSVFVQIARQAAFAIGFAGVVAGFWHIMPIAGMVLLIAAIVALAVQSIGYTRVEQDDAGPVDGTGDQQAPQP